MIRFSIVTIFPESFSSYLSVGMLQRALKKKVIGVSFYQPRDFVSGTGKKKGYKQVDDRPYGGGPGMVMKPEPILRAFEKACKDIKKRKGEHKIKVIMLSPTGKQFTNAYAQKLAKKYTDIIIISGRYEGIDARVKKITKAEMVSVGPYVLTGGELPALAIMDAATRFIPGVLGNLSSLEERRMASRDVYTRPPELTWGGKVHKVPKVLSSGHHAKIHAWKRKRKGGANA